MIASDIITRAGRILMDTANTRWTTAELLDYINDAMRQIVLYRPDANSKNEAVLLTTGTKQSLPAAGIRLLKLVRNMGSDGSTPGAAIREVSRQVLDAQNPDWHAISATSVQHFVFDDNNPRVFYVYPGAKSGASVYVDMIYSANPATATTTGSTLELGDQYINAVLDWVLYRAYSKDADYAGNLNRATTHLQAFMNDLQITMRTERMASAHAERSPMSPRTRGA